LTWVFLKFECLTGWSVGFGGNPGFVTRLARLFVKDFLFIFDFEKNKKKKKLKKKLIFF